MLKIKCFIEKYHLYYVSAIICVWIATLLLPWGTKLGEEFIYLFIMQKVFPVLGISLIIFSVILRKIKIFILGVCVIFAFWINLFLLFSVFPLSFGN